MLIPGTLSHVDPISGKEEIWLENGVVGKEKNWIRCLVQGQVEQINDVNTVPVRAQKMVQQIQGKFAGMMARLFSKEKTYEDTYIPTSDGELGDETAKLVEKIDSDTYLAWGGEALSVPPNYKLLSEHRNILLLEKKENTIKDSHKRGALHLDPAPELDKIISVSQFDKKLLEKWLEEHLLHSIKASMAMKNIRYLASKAPKFVLDEKFIGAMQKISSKKQFATGDYSSNGSQNEIFEIINEEILLPLDYFISVSSDEMGIFVSIESIESSTAYSYEDGILPIKYIRRITPLNRKKICSFDGNSMSVLMDIDGIIDSLPTYQKFSKNNKRNGYFANSKDDIFQNTNNLFDSLDHLHSRVLIEELRHGMDAFRQIKQSGGIDIHSIIRNKVNINSIANIGSKQLLQSIYSELSAQMTTAAIEPLVFNEWNIGLSAKPKPSAHDFAGRIAICLLAKELQLTQQNLSKEMLYDVSNLEKFLQNIMCMEFAIIRLALKSVYEKEFNYPIDEAPFFKIDENGNILNRKVWSLPHQEKKTSAESDQITHKSIQDILESVLKNLPK